MTKALYILYILLLLLLGAASPVLAQTINGEVYGGGEMSKVDGSTNVTVNQGNLGSDIFGGGEGKLNNEGTISMSADVSNNTHVTINGGEFAVRHEDVRTPGIRTDFAKHYNIYGGGNIASEVGETHVYVKKGMISKDSDGTGLGDHDAGTFLQNSNDKGIAQAYYQEGQMYFCIFGGGYGKNTRVTGNTWVDFNISGMTDINSTAIEDDLLEYQSYLDVIGGGFNGTVGGNTNVHVGGNAMCRNVYGGGLYAAIGTEGQSTKGNTNVYITGGNIDNVYGGGVMGDIMTSTNVNIGLKEASLSFDGRSHDRDNNKVTILMSVYGANDVSGHVPTANITHNGGTIDQNIYGAGNGDYRGYYTPGVCDYADGENDNYFPVDHSGDTSRDGKSTKGPKGDTYKCRPQTDNVNITIGGTGYGDDRAIVLGQVFGGGNSCTVGRWHTEWVEAGGKYAGKPHDARDDKDYFIGEGSINITLKDHVKIGYDNTTLADASDDIKDMYTRDGENVSGLFMGCSGDVLATQSTAEDDYDYHHYYDKYTAKYWPGFAVYQDDGNTPLSRAEGLKSFNAYLNNILVWTNDVQLNFADGATDIWLANFVGGGFRGSMKRKDSNAFQWTLPASVTVGNCIVGGAYNTDVVYRIYATSDGHTYTTEKDPKTGVEHYQYLTNPEGLQIVDNEHLNGDYHHLEKDVEEHITGIVRFMYGGGLLDKNDNPADVVLTLYNKMDGGENAGVFGGCYSSGTVKNTEINYYATGAHSVYGGGALANITGNSVVNLFGGSLTDAYGGGLGRNLDVENRKTAVSALVYGDATTTLNGSIVNGSIYGANNVNGTPLGHVKVHVLHTQKRPIADSDPVAYEEYDVPAVYGGGNQAAYVPTGSIGEANSLTDKSKFAEVLIENCDNSIAYVYGGGNAAPVPATKVTIYGANAIDYAFAGGNGKGDGNKGADIGYLGFFSETGESTPKYGYGETDIKIYGGTINNVFGGSNTLGYIREHASVEVFNAPDDYEGTTCDLHLGDVHAGGNQAEMYCGGSVTLACSEGADVVYAGANEANIHGDIDLTITSGTFGKVFGGNNISGNVYGHIKIDIDETGCWPVMIGELYACGNEAAYSVYGYTDEGPRTKEEYDDMTDEERIAAGLKDKNDNPAPYDDPTINLISFTRIGKVFGGGLGETAVVHGNPHVNVEPITGKFANWKDSEDKDCDWHGTPNYILDASDQRVPNTSEITISHGQIGTIGTIYGGGNAGAVYGNTTVNIGTLAKNKHISGTDKTTEQEVAVTITGDIFGGGNEAIVSGDTKVQIGETPTLP